jgi:hypothetical protein
MFIRLSKLSRLELKIQAIYVSSLKGLIMSNNREHSLIKHFKSLWDDTGIAWSFSSRRESLKWLIYFYLPENLWLVTYEGALASFLNSALGFSYAVLAITEIVDFYLTIIFLSYPANTFLYPKTYDRLGMLEK